MSYSQRNNYAISHYSPDFEDFEPPQKHNTFFNFQFGLSNYLGDLGGNTGIGRKFVYDNNFKKRTFFYGFGITKIWYEAIGFRVQLIAGKIAGSDQDAVYKNTSDPAYFRYKRNLDFQSNITEGSLLLETYPFKYFSFEKRIHHWHFQPYVLLGVGLYHFNPQGSYYDEIAEDYVWVDLKPLQTEGQGMKEYPSRKPYNLTQFNMPFGLGFRYDLGNKTSLSIEFLGRKLFTDYLDDVSKNYIDPTLYDKYLTTENAEIAKAVNNKSNLISPDFPFIAGDQRGQPRNNDFYYSFNIKLNIQVNKVKVVKHKKYYKFDDSEICF